ncbi:Zn(II)2Cys6 transcription factor NDAI_0D03550 [Naumovozyma dairenensis CBS 421]|uniref:Zn(2)-C6 fungal-type domain-containing protein n=1 Tax=Naumovozyma dairenensis (strain ATCC 10597 / BCRC 20456 / CBS 421 / NBRC 0211 / NRRL Y-12639) TaxID=1071378 RepID=G0WA58_NAUDC|nr:hypothetical protein NDAI_0D03550 [Naumovozyma dairenensis CBS 421]CCD24669.1 hypothetical protein NDAI_0D03550 [Naumovozyma dairenensis CBS 421]
MLEPMNSNSNNMNGSSTLQQQPPMIPKIASTPVTTVKATSTSLHVPTKEKKIRKPSNKVTKACDNCRRRKIKCTGKTPCATCEAYQCLCIYSTQRGRKNGNSNNSNNSTSNNNNSNNENTNVINNIENSKMPGYKSLSPIVLNELQNNLKLKQNTKNKNNIPGKGIPNSRTCNPYITQQFVSNDEMPLPVMTLVDGDPGPYEDDKKFQNQLITLQSVQSQLELMGPSISPEIDQSIKNINIQIKNLIENWNPEINFDKLNTIPNNDLWSVETHLMKNKYTDQVHLNNFSIWSDSQMKGKERGTVAFSKEPLIDEIFGLYSPYQAFSIQGIGYCFRTYLKPKQLEPSLSTHTKETLYIVLRLFDMSFHQINENCISIASPLESYLRRRSLMPSPMTPLSAASTYNNNTTSSVGSPNTATEKSLVAILINRLPQPFVQNMTSLTNNHLLNTMNDDFAMFKLILKMCEAHRNGFEKLMMNSIPGQTPPARFTQMKPDALESYSCFCEEEEILLALAYSYYNSTLYHIMQSGDVLVYLELLVSLLEHQLWSSEFYGFEKVTCVAVNHAMRLGLPRWEYYVGLDEATAERRRRIWWKLYCFEKIIILETGTNLFIDERKMNCLLTSDFREAGFLNSVEFIEKVDKIPRSKVFDKMNIKELKSYGECAMLQIASNLYSELLYNERYTSIKNISKPEYIKEIYMNEIIEEVEKFKRRLEAVKSHTSFLFNLSVANTNTGAAALADKIEACSFVQRFEDIKCSMLGAVDVLVTRLSSSHPSLRVISIGSKILAEIYSSWRTLTGLLLAVDNDFYTCTSIQRYGAASVLLLTSRYFTGNHITLNDLFNMVHIFKRCNTCVAATQSNNGFTQSNTIRAQRMTVSFVAILCRIIILRYLQETEISREELFTAFEGQSSDLAVIAQMILDAKSKVYSFLLEPVQKSGFHLTLKKILDYDLENPQKRRNSKKNYNAASKTKTTRANSNSNMPIHNLLNGTTGANITGPPLSQQQQLQDQQQLSSPQQLQKQQQIHQQNFCGMSTPEALPSIKSLTNANAGNISSFPSYPNTQPPSQLDAISENDNSELMNLMGNNCGAAFNLGTLDEFVNNADIDDLYNVLWGDLYTDAVL